MIMDGDTNLAYSESAYGAISNSNLSEEKRKPVDTTARSPSFPRRVGGVRTRIRTTITSQQKIYHPTARNSITKSPIVSNQINACGTKSPRATDSNEV
jgi:hypothetical protein